MHEYITAIVGFLVLLNFYLLSTARLSALVRGVGMQGVLLALLPLFLSGFEFESNRYLIALGTLLIKGVLIPYFLLRALRSLPQDKELTPVIGYTLSIVVCILFTAFSFYAASRMRDVFPIASVMAPAAISTALCGLFLIIARRQALTQIAGYLVFENGIYVFGVALSVHNPLLVELGVLLDVLVGVFVMGIVVHHISRDFDTISMPLVQEKDQ